MDLKTSLILYEKLYRLRRSEKAILDHYFEDDMKTPMHMSMGSEAIAVGICHAMTDDDYVLGTYRSHALYLAKTGDVDTFFAEMYGKKSGCSKGKSGSMHLSSPKQGHMGSSAVVGSHIAAGVGCAFAHKYRGKEAVAAAFFGDAATDEGVFWESLNVACLMQVPMIFVCENNGFSVHTPNKARRGYSSLDKIVEQYDCDAVAWEGTDVEQVYQIASRAIERAKKDSRPAFLHLEYYRYLEHVGIGEDYDAGYRSRSDYENWVQKDPIATQRIRLQSLGVSEIQINEIESRVNEQVLAALEFAQNEPFCDKDEVLRDVFYENT